MVWKIALIAFILISTAGVWAWTREHDPQRWESDIQKFELEQAKTPQPENGILFLGSSSIRLWNLEKWFPERKTINRGFGGSHIEDSVYYVNRLVYPLKPKTIVFYAGDNDVAGGKSARRVFEDYQRLVALVHETLPDTRMVYVAIKPSRLRWRHVNTMREANRLIQKWSENDPRLDFADIDAPMLGEDGKPMKGLFKTDRLHLNEKGYELWTSVIKPFLSK